MEPTRVVTCFLRNRDDVLLLERSETVGTYRGKWAGVSGYVEHNPDDSADREIREETGLHEDVTLVRRGEPFLIEDTEAGETWEVNPYLFECDSRSVELNEESTDCEWVPPTEILRRDTVPALWTSYDHVAPNVETVAADTDHGSAYVTLRALDVLRDRAGEAATRNTANWDDLAGLADALLDARPSMAGLANRVNRAMATADERTPAAVETAAQAVIDDALRAGDAVAEAAADRITGASILTLSRSGTVLATLRAGDPDSVIVAESRPAREGVWVAEELASQTEVTLTTDAAVAHVFATRDVDVLLVGADTLLPDGRVVNKAGTRGAALAAAREDVPVIVATSRDKVATTDAVHFEAADPGAVYDGDASLSVENPRFDVTPADLVSSVITEDSVLAPDDLQTIAEDHRRHENW